MSWWQRKLNCQQCGEEFDSSYFGNHAKYCSNKCRQKAYRERKKESLQSTAGNRNGQGVTSASREA